MFVKPIWLKKILIYKNLNKKINSSILKSKSHRTRKPKKNWHKNIEEEATKSSWINKLEILILNEGLWFDFNFNNVGLMVLVMKKGNKRKEKKMDGATVTLVWSAKVKRERKERGERGRRREKGRREKSRDIFIRISILH